MSKTKHTPGSWAAHKYPDVKTWTVAASESVASKIKTQEDAHLIAAAPEMLEALEKMKETLEIFKKGSSFSMNYELCLINQAIAKAKGE